MSYEIEIYEGHNPSSYFWIRPVLVKTSPKIILEDDIFVFEDEFCIEEEYVDCFLKYFLYKYFNSEWECNHNRFEYGLGYRREFEWYFTHNFYTYDALKKMCGEILKKADLLENNFEDASLTELKERFSIFCMCERTDPDYMAGNSSSSIKRHIHVVTQFYRRFVKRLTKMMVDNPQTNIISFMGP